MIFMYVGVCVIHLSTSFIECTNFRFICDHHSMAIVNTAGRMSFTRTFMLYAIFAFFSFFLSLSIILLLLSIIIIFLCHFLLKFNESMWTKTACLARWIALTYILHTYRRTHNGIINIYTQSKPFVALFKSNTFFVVWFQVLNYIPSAREIFQCVYVCRLSIIGNCV